MFLESFLAVMTGLMVFVFSQLVLKLVIDPMNDHRLVVGEIAAALIYYANVYSNPGILREDLTDAAQTRLRELASRLTAATHALRLPRFCAWFHMTLPQRDCYRAASVLIGLSNGLSFPPDKVHSSVVDENANRRAAIVSLLRLRLPQ